MSITGRAHAAICVPNVDDAVAWYQEVLGMKILALPYLMEGDAIDEDMGEMIPGVSVKAAIVGFERSDNVIELIEYPNHAAGTAPRSLTDRGTSHLGLLCDDLASTRAGLEEKGVHFLTSARAGAGIAGLRTTWFEDPYGVVFILLEKSRTDRPYWSQFFGSE